MFPAVSLRPRAAGWRALLLLALASASLPAAAQSMACGTYRQDDGHATLTIESEAHGFIAGPYQATEQLRLARQDNILAMGNLSTGALENREFSDDDRTITGGYHDFHLERAAACKPVPDMVEGSCMANTSDCLDALPRAEPAQLHAWCSEGIEVACNTLYDHYQMEADRELPQLTGTEPVMPDICREESPAYEADSCMAMVKVMASELIGRSIMGLDKSRRAPLTDAQLDELTALCRQQQAETFCDKVADALWTGGRLQPSLDALQRSCAQRADAYACTPAKALAPLSALGAASLAAVPASALPCGSYEATNGLLSELRFVDTGLVEVPGLDTRLRARLQDGQIHIRRDVGSDFVLQPLANGNLAGIDRDHRYAYFVRKPASAEGSCKPPLAFVEIPMPLDCPTVGRRNGAEACCSDGKLLGCKVAGEARYKAEKWAASLPYFETLCSAGVREGCLAMAEVYAKTADPKIPHAMAALCAKDAKGTHVACDVDATRNWPALKAAAMP